ncbi:MAG: dihydroorotate dehydrogenase-like protein [Anaerolineales bacterium]|nr:dihydroorotate dehydrogenase-like protein [Anaerolineales bacterium]
MADLATTYLGLKLKNPLVASASPLSANVDSVKQLEAAGAAAVVLPSLFEEQIEVERMRLGTGHRDLLPEGLRHVPDLAGYNQGLSGYIAHLYKVKKAVGIPVIASINAYEGGDWANYARILESAGADALELNIYYLAAKPHDSGAQVEQMYLNLVRDVRASLQKIPVAVKLSPYFSAMAHMAHQITAVGASGLVLFNRFYQPDFNIETREVEPSLELSSSAELRLRLRWAAILSPHLTADIAVTGGVHSTQDVVKAMMAGATVTMMTSALYKNGIGYLTTLRDGLSNWLDQHDYASVADVRGVMRQTYAADPAALERANYMSVLKSNT